EECLGLPAGSLTWQGPIAPDTDPLWRSMQREEISEREYWAHRASEIGALAGESGWGVRELLTRGGKATPKDAGRTDMRELISECRAQEVKVGILSNEMALFYGDAFLARMELLHTVDTIVDATHTGILKPDPRSYKQALEAMRLRAQEVLFVDDQFRNI